MALYWPEESKTFESRSKTLGLFIQFLYGDSITTLGVVELSMYCRWFYILFLTKRNILIKNLRNCTFSSAGNDTINTIPQICIEIHMISPPFFASCFLCIHSLQWDYSVY